MDENIKSINQNNFYRTSDLALATVLSLYFSIEEIERDSSSRKAFFIFKRNKNLDELLEKYWNRKLQIEPNEYFQQLKILKSRLYEE